jgi:hypothetical protein
LDLSAFGPCREVPEALRRDEYVASQMQPYFAVAAAFDIAAILACIWGMIRGKLPMVAVIAALAGNLSMALHLSLAGP